MLQMMLQTFGLTLANASLSLRLIFLLSFNFSSSTRARSSSSFFWRVSLISGSAICSELLGVGTISSRPANDGWVFMFHYWHLRATKGRIFEKKSVRAEIIRIDSDVPVIVSSPLTYSLRKPCLRRMQTLPHPLK